MDRQPTLPTLDTGAAEEATMSTSYTQGGEIKFGTERRGFPDSTLFDCVLDFVYIRIAIKSLRCFTESLRK